MQNFDNDWRFHKGDVDTGAAVGLDDSGWRRVTLPHDWMIEGPFVHDLPVDEFIDKTWGHVGSAPEESHSRSIQGYRAGGVGWYRKHFRLDERMLSHRHVFVSFDGVYMNADVWLNGHA